MRIKSGLLLGSVFMLITAVVFVFFSVNKREDPIPAQQEKIASTLLPVVPSIQQRVILFMGPMKPRNVDFESKIFDTPVSILDSQGNKIVLYYEPQDFSLNVAGKSIRGLTISRSKNNEWVSLRPISSPVDMSIGEQDLKLQEDDVLMFNLSGQDSNPSIVMEIWRDGLFKKQNMHIFFEEKSSQKPVQKIPNWILEILNT